MKKITMLFGATAIIGLAGSAMGQTYAYNVDFNAPGAPTGINNNGGIFDSLSTTFNHSTNRLTFSVTFANQVTKGFTLAINGGPNPKNNPGQLALFYFDASVFSQPKLTAYGYNGRNNQSSYRDADGNGINDGGDMIWGNDQIDGSLSAQDVNGKRVLSFSIDASDIISHTPLHPDPDGDPWTGAQFADHFGIWLHTFKNFNTTYTGNDLTNLNAPGGSNEGWFDGTMLSTSVIPLPSAAGMAGLGLISLGIRRRR